MIELLLSTILLAPPLPQDETPAPEPPDPELVAKTVERLETAYRSKDTEEQVRAIGEAGRVADAAVVKSLAKGLRQKDPALKEAVLQALRWMDHPDALKTLHRTYKSDRAIKKDPELSASLLKAIGQHGDRSSISILSDDPFSTRNYQAIKARVLGLGNIRDRKSVEALLGLMKSSAPRYVDDRMEDFRLALIMLTGTDQGPSSQMWLRWWNDNKKSFEVSPDVPELPRGRRQQWIYYWGLDRDYGRTQRRENRGKDGERRRSS